MMRLRVLLGKLENLHLVMLRFGELAGRVPLPCSLPDEFELENNLGSRSSIIIRGLARPSRMRQSEHSRRLPSQLKDGRVQDQMKTPPAASARPSLTHSRV